MVAADPRPRGYGILIASLHDSCSFRSAEFVFSNALSSLALSNKKGSSCGAMQEKSNAQCHQNRQVRGQCNSSTGVHACKYMHVRPCQRRKCARTLPSLVLRAKQTLPQAAQRSVLGTQERLSRNGLPDLALWGVRGGVCRRLCGKYRAGRWENGAVVPDPV